MINRAKQLVARVWPASDHTAQVPKFGTFGGVFTPDVLTILGVIMYLRLGWVVGNAGLLGAILIILLAKSVTLCTGMSISSITTNIKIGAGGAYSIITRSLGLEAGGSIGIPLYIAQTLSAALYIVGFSEGWLRIFPDHPSWLVSIIAWALLLAITSISADFAIRTQYLILGVLVLSVLSFLAAPTERVDEVLLIGSFEDAGFWEVFAVFFPAVTGIMAGANMSGDLANPRRAIPIGTMAAILVTMVVYLAMAYVAALVGNPADLRTNQMFMVDNALVGELVLAGILCATFSSALGSMLGAPRILQALAEHRITPYHSLLAAKTSANNPRNAILFTSAVILVSLAIDLDTLASLITMFFLITYGVLNLVVFIQQTMKIISFRPTFKIPRLMSCYGAVASLFMMFLIDPLFSIVAFITIVAIYLWLIRRDLDTEWGDIRGGMFLMLAEQASRIAEKFPKHTVSWKPDLLVPIEDPRVWSGPLFFIRSITYPTGSLFAFTITPEDDEKRAETTRKAIHDLLSPLKGHILLNSAVIEGNDFFSGARLVIQTLRGGSFRPNTLLLTVSHARKNDELIDRLTHAASQFGMGVIILNQHTRMAFGLHQNVNLWMRDKSPNWHLAVLLALQLHRNWTGTLNLITVTEDESQEEHARLCAFLQHVSDESRLPVQTRLHVITGTFQDALERAPRADMNIFGMATDEVSVDFMRQVTEQVKTSTIFVKDSGYESALA